MSAAGDVRLDDLIADIVKFLEREGALGERFKGHNAANELRFGKRGSLSIMVRGSSRGQWFDHEEKTGGGPWQLVELRGGHADVSLWLRDHHILDDPYPKARRNRAEQHWGNGSQIEATYDYVDETGQLLFQVVRYPGHGFRQRRPDGNGGWINDLEGVRRVLYHLPELIAATKTGNGHPWRAYLCEGEKDTDRLIKDWSVFATTNPMGAGNWNDSYDAYFAGAEVIILEDNDKAGRKRSAKLAARLARVAMQVRVIRLGGHEDDDGADISDWLDEGGSQSVLEDIIDNTEPYTGTEHDPGGAAGVDQKLLSLDFWLEREIAPPDFLLGEILSTTTRALLFAPTGIGKTNVALGIAMAIADGRDFLHWRGRGRPARVLYIDGEMSRRLMKQRLVDGVRRHGARPDTLFILNREDFPDMPPLDTEAGQNYIDGIIDAIGGVDLVVFDNIQSLISGDMKEEDGWRNTLPWIRDLTRRQIGQLWVHHTGHNEKQSYGTKTREWQLDTVIQLERAEDPTADLSFALSFPKARERTPDNRADFEAATITLSDDQWESTRQSRTRQRGAVTAKGHAFLDALDNTLAKYGQPRPHSGNCPSVTMDEWRWECVTRGVLDGGKPHSARTLLAKHRLELIGAGKIICNGDFVWRL